jgi:cytochrome oxidase Cu insertion factor (SCO1/SenC/PrrC family)
VSERPRTAAAAGELRRLLETLILGILLAGSSAAFAVSDADLWKAAGVRPAAQPVMAPAFSLRDVGGHTISLEQFRGRVVMLYFWATW